MAYPSRGWQKLPDHNATYPSLLPGTSGYSHVCQDNFKDAVEYQELFVKDMVSVLASAKSHFRLLT
jgi:hypothetical protein